MTRQEAIEELIRSFVQANYGSGEAEEPSWNIEMLAEYIDENL